MWCAYGCDWPHGFHVVSQAPCGSSPAGCVGNLSWFYPGRCCCIVSWVIPWDEWNIAERLMKTDVYNALIIKAVFWRRLIPYWLKLRVETIYQRFERVNFCLCPSTSCFKFCSDRVYRIMAIYTFLMRGYRVLFPIFMRILPIGNWVQHTSMCDSITKYLQKIVHGPMFQLQQSLSGSLKTLPGSKCQAITPYGSFWLVSSLQKLFFCFLRKDLTNKILTLVLAHHSSWASY